MSLSLSHFRWENDHNTTRYKNSHILWDLFILRRIKTGWRTYGAPPMVIIGNGISMFSVKPKTMMHCNLNPREHSSVKFQSKYKDFYSTKSSWKWVRSRNCGCLVTWFCYQLIAKPGNKTAAVSWPDTNVFSKMSAVLPQPQCFLLPVMALMAWCASISAPCIEKNLLRAVTGASNSQIVSMATVSVVFVCFLNLFRMPMYSVVHNTICDERSVIISITLKYAHPAKIVNHPEIIFYNNSLLWITRS